MNKSTFLVAIAVLAAIGALVALKSFVPATSAALQHRAAATTAMTRALTADMRPIVPSPVIDPNAAVFVGTGDGAGGGWIKP